MRQPLVAGNWKMNLDLSQAAALAMAVRDQSASAGGDRVQTLICPPHVYLHPLAQLLKASSIAVGAQDVYFERSGAFTGEVSAAMLKDVGCTFVVIGHSERRHTIGHLEDDRMINLKVRAAMDAGLVPILCVGETLAERQAGQTLDVLTYQVAAGLVGVRLASGRALVVAYEPVWAIGTGQNATAEQAQEAHAHIRGQLRGPFGKLADEIRILYGGSMKPDNAASITGQPDVDGGLVGGASLKAESFLGIVRAAAETAGR